MLERDLDVMALNETKVRSRKEEKFGSFKGVKSEVSERMHAKKM